MSLGFFSDIFLPTAPCENEYQEHFLGR